MLALAQLVTLWWCFGLTGRGARGGLGLEDGPLVVFKQWGSRMPSRRHNLHMLAGNGLG